MVDSAKRTVTEDEGRLVALTTAAKRLALAIPGITGIDYGIRYTNGKPVSSHGIRFHVAVKRPKSEVARGERIPSDVLGMPTDGTFAEYCVVPAASVYAKPGPLSDDEAAEFIRREKPQVVAFVQAETSTGVFQQSKAICDAAHEVDAVVIADCVTSLGAMPVEVDANGIDVAYSCTQKGLSAPPGLSPITISPRAQERLKARKTVNRSWYFDLSLISDYLTVSHRYHHTASATLFYALHEALAIIEDEGLGLRQQRHQKAHERFVAGVERLGLKMHVAPGHRIWNLNTPRVPEGVNEAKVRAYLLEKHGIEIAGGFGPLAGKIFRIGIMGPLATDEGVDRFLAKLDEAMKETA